MYSMSILLNMPLFVRLTATDFKFLDNLTKFSYLHINDHDG